MTIKEDLATIEILKSELSNQQAKLQEFDRQKEPSSVLKNILLSKDKEVDQIKERMTELERTNMRVELEKGSIENKLKVMQERELEARKEMEMLNSQLYQREEEYKHSLSEVQSEAKKHLKTLKEREIEIESLKTAQKTQNSKLTKEKEKLVSDQAEIVELVLLTEFACDPEMSKIFTAQSYSSGLERVRTHLEGQQEIIDDQ